MSKFARYAVGAAVFLGCVPFAAAEEWSGEGSLSAGSTTGNTETTDLGIGFKLARDAQLWTTNLEALADYAEAEGQETKNRLFGAAQLDRQLTDRAYGFGRFSHERDEFSGFESRTFAGVGAGYQVFDGDRTFWSVEAGPGFKIDEIGETTTGDAMGMTALMPGETVESVSFIAASNYAFEFNDNVRFTNDTDGIYAEESTQFINTAAVTATLIDALSARFSFDIRHDTNPPAGFESTDTATRISLVYTMGAGG
ncbi:MAG: DUF481 domain-containing protein [Pseudomonadota bacterium]